jgi:hypothetical protein
MYAIVITRLVKAAMIFATSTFTSIVICIFMVRIPLNCSLTALLDYVKNVIVLWWRLGI